MTTVIVAGAGLAGLVAARHLARLGLDVQMFEREDEVGGRVRTRRKDGFVLDRGFQVLFTAYPAARRELDYDDLDLRRFAPGAVLAHPGERSVLADPVRDPSTVFGSMANREVRLGDKLRTLRLRRKLARTPNSEIFSGEDEAIEEYLRERGFSDAFRENFAGPFYGGITLDRPLSTSKKVFEFTFKMLSTGDIAVPANGMGEIAEQLARKARVAGATIQVGDGVSAVEPNGDEVNVEVGGETLTADAAVVATDPKSARELSDVESIPTHALGCVTQYFSHAEPLDVGNRLLLNVGDDAPNEVVPLSSVAPEYAPDDRELLSATFLGTPDDSDAELAETVERTLREWYPERTFPDLERVHTDRIEFAQFAQPPGIFDRLPGNRTHEKSVYLAGEYTEASSLNAAMESGRKAALAVYGDLR
ncbi:NAD(P)/FAD-dependent oxidoreductase [Haladaptatus sp. DYF46]|uniref:NAD(P)/FAD-dependent oxidoreductase n=1 Tax=Haladaptatus sp. DYF46 TaxID=2886041 RepID=UPI001E4BB2A8|nr:NAD(P)/FAD-dependent oxidoreductase [Haladaptatus sp. DYF46]